MGGFKTFEILANSARNW